MSISTISSATPTAAWLVIDDLTSADHGLFARDADGNELVADRRNGTVSGRRDRGVKPALKGRFKLADGREAVPVFELLARKYLDAHYAPEATATTTGVSAEQTRSIAAQIAHAAFEEIVTIEQPWTDMNGERHERMIGRPVSFHAMRGISAHSNGFQSARALHLLQILIGSIDSPRRLPLQAALSATGRGTAKAAWSQPAMRRAAAGTASGISGRARAFAARKRRRHADTASTRRFPGMRRCRPTASCTW